MFIINPPYTLPNILDETMPVLTKILEQDSSANSLLVSNIM
jgi:23S rRNA (adenine2030-N6)-methyltransferase